MFSYPPLKTGQTTVYTVGDNGINQSGVARDYTGPTQDPAYTSDYTTTDNVTGLVWKTCSEGSSGATCTGGAATIMDWSTVQNSCNSLNTQNSGAGYAGRKDWRLPTGEELETLVDYSKYSPAIGTSAFPAVTGVKYWGSTSFKGYETDAVYVNFNGGTMSHESKGYSLNYVRCVSDP